MNITPSPDIAHRLDTVLLSYEVHISTQAISAVFSISIDCRHGQHDQLTMHVPLSVIDPAASTALLPSTDVQKLLGKVADVVIKNAGSSSAARLEGRFIITGLAFQHSYAAEPTLIVTGHSPTWALDGMPHFESFLEKNLTTIVDKIAAKTLQQFEATLQAAPTFRDVISYSCCFGESSWQYLQRLAARTGQWLYYNNRTLIFGAPHSGDEAVSLVYGGNCHELSMRTVASAVSATFFAYQSKSDSISSADARTESGSAGSFAEEALKKSGNVFGSHPSHRYAPSFPADKGVVELQAKAHSASVASGLYTLNGSSRLIALKVGARVQLNLGRIGEGEEQHPDMRITAIRHYYDCSGAMYENSFEAISAGAQSPPVKMESLPRTYPVNAKVIDNEDPTGQGRVRVQMSGWNQDHSQQETDWIRVVSVDAGGGPDNRGVSYVPELGDGVIVDFEEGNPDMPFVTGSVFNGGNASGQSHMIRSITTKTGHTVELNDNNGGTSIIIKDKSGNIIHLDTQGSNITITAPETMTLHARNIYLNADESVSISAGENVNTAAGMNIAQAAMMDYTLMALNILEIADKDMVKTAENIEKTAAKVRLSSTEENIELHSAKDIENKNNGKIKLF